MKALFVTLIFILCAPNFAHAVRTAECPRQLTVHVGGLVPVREALDPEDKDIAKITIAYRVLQNFDGFVFTAPLRERGPGRCVYSDHRGAFAEMYTKQSKHILSVQTVLVPERPGVHSSIGLRVYAQIESMVDGVIRLKDQRGYGAMTHFWGSPSAYYDGGWELRKIGFARFFQVE